MFHALQRGSVLLRERRWSVVWEAAGRHLVLLPLLVPEQTFRFDVALSLPDLVACGGAPASSVVRARPGRPALRKGERLVGALPGPAMDRVAQRVMRSAEEAIVEARWAADIRHRRAARGERCANF